MTHLKSYLGSIVLAGLLLQGCGSDSSSNSAPLAENNSQTGKQEPTAPSADTSKATAVEKFNFTSSLLSSANLSDADYQKALSDLTLKFTALDGSNADFKAYIDSVLADNSEITTRAEAYAAVAEAYMTDSSSKAPRRGIFSNLKDAVTGGTDKIKGGLVDLLDSSAGDAVTGAAFDVVLNSEGVTVVMLDAARASNTTSEIMVNALEANWSLTEKMCPMLRDNVEFGEKFTALAEERDIIGRFFFERIDATMYNCLSDAMLLSNRETGEHSYKIGKPVKHSTNGYMALLMDRYAKDYFIMPTGSTDDRRADKFVGLLLDTGAHAAYDAETKTFTGHGDGNELINEKFFYSLFKTPTSTDMFVSAMQKIDPAVKKMLMDNIFLGQPVDTTAPADTEQGYLNIIAIGSAMYDGIYGEPDVDGVRKNGYGFGSYMGAFVGFAGLIPSDRYMTYGKAFVDAGYEYAKFHGIDVWSGVSEAAKYAWDTYTGTEETNATTTASAAPAHSAGRGITGSPWSADIIDIMWSGWANVDLSSVFDEILNGNFDVTTQLQDQANVAYATVIDGRDANGTKAYPTTISNDTPNADTVYGLHGLVELAMQEDVFYVNCGNQSINNATCENNSSYTMDDAKESFTLPPFADITLDFVYNKATDGVMAYYNDNINGQEADWLADLSNNDLIREYFYPDATNTYIPSWLLAIDWLKVPASVVNTDFAGTDFDFNAGYFDVYVTSKDAALTTTYASILEGIRITKVDMGSDSIIAVDENGQTMEGLYVYKLRAVSQEDLDAIFAAISELGDEALSAVGLDSSNASTVDTTDANTTTAQ